MSLDPQTVFAEALALPPDLRENLAEKLWQSLDKAQQEEISAAWITEIESRMEALERGEMKAIPVEEAIRSIRQRIGTK